MLAFAVIFFQCIEHYLEMAFVAQEIGIRSVYYQGFEVVLFDVIGIGKLQGEQVVVGNGLFKAAVALADIVLQLGHRHMEVDQDVGLNELLEDNVEQPLEQPELFIGQVHFGKEEAFGEQVVRDGNVLKQVLGVDQLFELFVPFGHKKQLQRKSKLPGAFIKLRQERIVRKLFQDQPGIVMLGKQVGQGRFTGSDISFYGDKVMVHALIWSFDRENVCIAPA